MGRTDTPVVGPNFSSAVFRIPRSRGRAAVSRCAGPLVGSWGWCYHPAVANQEQGSAQEVCRASSRGQDLAGDFWGVESCGRWRRPPRAPSPKAGDQAEA